MIKMSRKWLFLRSSVFYTLLLIIVTAFGQTNTRQAYEGSFLYLTNSQGEDYPNDTTPSWGDNDWGTNGIGHDDENWYICSNGLGIAEYNDDWVVWKIPRVEKLDQDFDNHPNKGVISHDRSYYKTLDDLGYKHVGDVDCCLYDNEYYLVVPITGKSPAAIAFFHAKTLKYINLAFLPKQSSVGWCAVSPVDSNLYTSEDNPIENENATRILCYSIDWKSVFNQNKYAALTFLEEKSSKLRDEGGNLLELFNMQGGEFSPSGELLFVSCGIHWTDLHPGIDGLHVFETSHWKRVEKSYNIRSVRFLDSPVSFVYSFDNEWDTMQEPQGLTYWDLNDGRAPEISGELHVLLMNYEYVNSCKVWLKHYTRKMYIDCTAPPHTPKEEWDYPPLCGTRWEPFNSIKAALEYYCHDPLGEKWFGPWDGAEMVIRKGNYPENLIISNRIRIVSEGGTVIIGE